MKGFEAGALVGWTAPDVEPAKLDDVPGTRHLASAAYMTRVPPGSPKPAAPPCNQHLVVRDDLKGGETFEVVAASMWPLAKDLGRPVRRTIDLPAQHERLSLDDLRKLYGERR